MYEYRIDRDSLENNLEEVIEESSDYDLQYTDVNPGGREVIEAHQPTRPVDSLLGKIGIMTWPVDIRYEVSESDVEVKVEHRFEVLGEKLDPEKKAEEFLQEALDP